MEWSLQGRCAGVSSFGFSGTNSHVNLQDSDLDSTPTYTVIV